MTLSHCLKNTSCSHNPISKLVSENLWYLPVINTPTASIPGICQMQKSHGSPLQLSNYQSVQAVWVDLPLQNNCMHTTHFKISYTMLATADLSSEQQELRPMGISPCSFVSTLMHCSVSKLFRPSSRTFHWLHSGGRKLLKPFIHSHCDSKPGSAGLVMMNSLVDHPAQSDLMTGSPMH